MTTQHVLDVHALRLDHRALRAERSRVGWWRRLVRARLDLLVARAVGPQPLGEELAFQLPLDVGLDVPRPDELEAVLGGHRSGTHLDQLTALRALDSRLVRYQDGVDAALAAATERLIGHLAGQPDAVLGPVPEHESRN